MFSRILIIVAEIEAEKTCTSGSETQLQEPRPLSTISAVRSGPTQMCSKTLVSQPCCSKNLDPKPGWSKDLDTEPRCAEDSVAPTMIEPMHVVLEDSPKICITPFDISPVPLMRKRVTTRGRKPSKSQIITSSPYKANLEISSTQSKKRKRKEENLFTRIE
jgi:hypothetical protein